MNNTHLPQQLLHIADIVTNGYSTFSIQKLLNELKKRFQSPFVSDSFLLFVFKTKVHVLHLTEKTFLFCKTFASVQTNLARFHMLCILGGYFPNHARRIKGEIISSVSSVAV